MAMSTMDLTDTVQASLKGGPEAVLSIWDGEKETSVRIPWDRAMNLARWIIDQDIHFKLMEGRK